jgi:hypothetical protein
VVITRIASSTLAPLLSELRDLSLVHLALRQGAREDLVGFEPDADAYGGEPSVWSGRECLFVR